jgi:DNA-binding Lrp family transcriptional regulator
MINVEVGQEDKVLLQVKKLNAVEKAYVSYGVYDLVLKIRAPTLNDLKDTVTHDIRTIKNVMSSLTLIEVEE